jgi:hypothetical protein
VSWVKSSDLRRSVFNGNGSGFDGFQRDASTEKRSMEDHLFGLLTENNNTEVWKVAGSLDLDWLLDKEK